MHIEVWLTSNNWDLPLMGAQSRSEAIKNIQVLTKLPLYLCTVLVDIEYRSHVIVRVAALIE